MRLEIECPEWGWEGALWTWDTKYTNMDAVIKIITNISQKLIKDRAEFPKCFSHMDCGVCVRRCKIGERH